MKKRRWQDKRFYLLDWYKYAMFQIIANHRKLSPGAKGFGHALLNLFGTKPWFPMNMRELARHCGVSERAARNFRHELEAAKLFRFAVPPYWARKNKAKATEIHFRTATVTKWLRNHGMLTAQSDWVSRNDKPETPSRSTDEMGTSSQSPAINADGEVGNPCGSKRTPLTTGKMSSSLPYSKEGGAKPAAPSLMARDASDVPPKENSHGLGAKFWGDDDRELWFAATTEHPDGLPHGFILGSRLSWNEEHCTLRGFPVDEITRNCVLVEFGGRKNPSWIEVEDLALATQEEDKGRLGAGYSWYDDDEEGHKAWFEATTEHLDGIPDEFEIGARIKWEGCSVRVVAGYGLDMPDQTDDARNLLVLWDDERDGDDVIPRHLGWIGTHQGEFKVLPESEPEPAKPTLEPMYGFEVGDRVSCGNRPIGTVTGFYACVGVVVDFGNGHETVAPGSLELVPRAEVDTGACRAGTRVRHLKYGDGSVIFIDGNKVTVQFDKHAERNILLPFLQIINNEADLGFPTEEHDATGSVPGDTSQGLVG